VGAAGRAWWESCRQRSTAIAQSVRVDPMVNRLVQIPESRREGCGAKTKADWQENGIICCLAFPHQLILKCDEWWGERVSDPVSGPENNLQGEERGRRRGKVSFSTFFASSSLLFNILNSN
jgi:hypothetical protein